MTIKISNRIAHSPPLATTAMHARADALRRAGKPVIDLSIAISHFAAPEPVAAAVEAAVARREAMPYADVIGEPAVRAALADKLRRENGVEAGVDEIIVTNGAKQAYYQALYALTDPGDTIAVFRPYWPAYLATARLLGLNVVLADLPDTLNEAALDALGPLRVLVINNPHNPSGKVYGRAELELLRDWSARRGVCVICDESYEHLVFEGRHLSLAALGGWRDPGVVTLFSASQSYAMMGWRVGFALAPAPLVQAMQSLQGPVTAAVPHLSQVAAQAAFGSGAPHALLRDYRARRDAVVARCAALPWMRLPAPPAGPYLWADVRRLTHDTLAFAESLLEQALVAVMPGEALGLHGHIRLGYIQDDAATLMEGIERIAAFGDGCAVRAVS